MYNPIVRSSKHSTFSGIPWRQLECTFDSWGRGSAVGRDAGHGLHCLHILLRIFCPSKPSFPFLRGWGIDTRLVWEGQNNDFPISWPPQFIVLAKYAIQYPLRNPLEVKYVVHPGKVLTNTDSIFLSFPYKDLWRPEWPTMIKSVLYPSQISLEAIHRSPKNGKLCCARRETRTQNLDAWMYAATATSDCATMRSFEHYSNCKKNTEKTATENTYGVTFEVERAFTYAEMT